MAARSPELDIEEIVAFGTDRRRGNLVAIQPYMRTLDYRSAAAFQAKIRGYFEVVRQQDWLNPRTIVVLPEYLGTWLVAVNEGRALYRAAGLDRAMLRLLLGQPSRFVRNWLAAQGPDRVKDALFRMKAADMAAVYHQVFSGLAASYGVTLVAGSIVLPSPTIQQGQLVVGEGPLYNTTVVYQPTGQPYSELVFKVHPIAEELPFTTPAAVEKLPVFETPAGRLGVLICADSWYDDAYQVLRAKDCQLIVVPNNLMPGGVWTKPWKGYDPGPAPRDVDLQDAGRLQEGEAWLKYALAGRMADAGASHGIHVFLRGQLWGMESDGHTIMVGPPGVQQAAAVGGAALVNFWIN